jgi:hypothetical protein
LTGKVGPLATGGPAGGKSDSTTEDALQDEVRHLCWNRTVGSVSRHAEDLCLGVGSPARHSVERSTHQLPRQASEGETMRDRYIILIGGTRIRSGVLPSAYYRKADAEQAIMDNSKRVRRNGGLPAPYTVHLLKTPRKPRRKKPSFQKVETIYHVVYRAGKYEMVSGMFPTAYSTLGSARRAITLEGHPTRKYYIARFTRSV